MFFAVLEEPPHRPREVPVLESSQTTHVVVVVVDPVVAVAVAAADPF